jgi:phospholipid/cholesterol/gamma-HCH transport system substrate-binding protein
MPKNIWDRRRRLTYVKVGSFFLVAIILAFITITSLREVHVFRGSYRVIVKFTFAEGLRPSSPVRFCGVDVGEVERVIIKRQDGKPLVYVYAKIQNGVDIPKDSYFFVNSLSLFGEKYLEITPPPLVAGYISADTEVEGVSPIPLFNVFATFTKTMKEINEFIKEGEIKTSFENILSNVEDISIEVKGLLEDVKNKEGTIGRLFYDDSLYRTTEEFILELKENPWKLLHKPKEKRRR